MPFRHSSQSLGPGLEGLLKRGREELEQYLAWRRSRLGLRGLWLYLLASPLALGTMVSLAKGQFSAAAATGVAFGLIACGAFFNRRGLLEELVTAQRRFTRSWGLPYKYLAAFCLAGGTLVAASAAVGQDAWVSSAFSLLTLAGYHMAYRLPRPRLGFARPDFGALDKALQKSLAQAELRVLSIEKAAYRIGNLELEERLKRIAGQGRAILDQVVARPEERFKARKFLNVHLEGAERVASRYAKTHRLPGEQELEQKFRSVLIDIEKVFDQQLTSFAEHDAFDLDVQIEVLRKQLKREGIDG